MVSVNDDFNKIQQNRFACQVNPTTTDATQRTAGTDPQTSAAVIQGREAVTSDGFQSSGQVGNPAKPVDDATVTNNNVNSDVGIGALNAKLQAKDLTDPQKKEVDALIQDLSNGNYAEASKHYQTLLTAGVITEDLGKVPFKEEMEKAIQQEKADDFADSLNNRENLRELHDKYQENAENKNANLKEEYGLDKSSRSFRRANKKLAKSSGKQLALQQTYVKGSQYTVELRDEQGKKTGETQVMDGEDAYKYQKEHDPDFQRKAKTYTLMSDRGLKTAEIIDKKLRDKGKAGIITKDANGNVTIDVEKAQAYAREWASTAGNRADKNELKQLAAELGVKEKDVKQFLKGINVDYQKDKRWIGAAVGTAVGAATTYLAAKAFAHGKTTGGTPDTEKTTIDNQIITVIDKNGGKHTDTISKVITEIIPGAPGKALSWLSKILPGLGIGIPAGVASAALVNALVNRDVNILKKGHSLADALDDPNFVKKDENRKIMENIKNAPVGPYAADSPEAKLIKLAILGNAMGANEGGKGKLNKQELIGAMAQINKCNEDYKKDPNKGPDLTVDQPGAGDEPGPKPEPTVTERTVLDIGGDGFFDLTANDGKGDFLKGADGNNLGQIGDGDGAVGLKGSIGHARDWEKLRSRKAPTEGNDVNAKAQYVIADEKGETTVTPDSGLTGAEAYESPSAIMLRDNTNGKDNAYKYRKLSDEEAKQYVPEGAVGPFYILDSASDANRSLKAKNIEVYSLKLEPEEQVVEEKDADGNITRTKVRRFKYNLEQYKGYAGSNQTSMFWKYRAK